MGYDELWKTLADLLIDLQKLGKTLPTNVLNELRSAKTMIQILKTDPFHTENVLRVERYLGTVESTLLLMAQDEIGQVYVEKWMRKLEKARRTSGPSEKKVSSFIAGLPREKRWIRIRVSEDIPLKDIKKLILENDLLYKAENEHLIVYGADEKIKAFIKRFKELV